MSNAELQSDLDACHVKEGDRLDFVEKLTAKTMLLQSDHCLLEVKVSRNIKYAHLFHVIFVEKYIDLFLILSK